VRAQFSQTGHYFYGCVQSDEIAQPKSSCFGSSNSRTGEFIYFMQLKPELGSQLKYFGHGGYANPVTNKSRCVFTQHGLFTEPGISEFHKEIDDGRVRIPSRDNFQQWQITWGVEKVCTQKMFPEIIRSTLCHQMNRNPRCIGG